MRRGRLLVIEGIDGCGKSTQAERLSAALRAARHPVVATREPSDGPHGRRIRAMARAGQALEPEEELRWFLEDREDHVRTVVAPGLEAGSVVVSDRYFLSTAAYQGARGLDAAAILADCEAAFPLPDVAFVLELDPGRALERAAARGAGLDRVFERPEYLVEVARNFRRLERAYIARIEASGDADTVHASLLAELRARLSIP